MIKQLLKIDGSSENFNSFPSIQFKIAFSRSFRIKVIDFFGDFSESTIEWTLDARKSLDKCCYQQEKRRFWPVIIFNMNWHFPSRCHVPKLEKKKWLKETNPKTERQAQTKQLAQRFVDRCLNEAREELIDKEYWTFLGRTAIGFFISF